MIEKYAELLVEYSLNIQKGDKLYIKSTQLATPLVKEICKKALKKGAHVEMDLAYQGQTKDYFENASDDELRYVSIADRYRFETFDAYLNIRAPYPPSDGPQKFVEKEAIRREALKEINEIYFRRTGNLELKRTLCQYPTQASADLAGMSLEEYSDFVYTACKLNLDDPVQGWLDVRASQQVVTDYLNKCETIRYSGENIDLEFSCKGRIWINSDGMTNMPSGEVYTAPVDDSANGWVRFSYPSFINGTRFDNIQLEFKDGYLISWVADNHVEVLDRIFETPGARRLGEAAIGMNYSIQEATGNILFDEKIGGSVHLAVGQAYKQCNGVNNSSIHWDMITDMQKDGVITADGVKIYEKGKFLI